MSASPELATEEPSPQAEAEAAENGEAEPHDELGKVEEEGAVEEERDDDEEHDEASSLEQLAKTKLQQEDFDMAIRLALESKKKSKIGQDLSGEAAMFVLLADIALKKSSSLSEQAQKMEARGQRDQHCISLSCTARRAAREADQRARSAMQILRKIELKIRKAEEKGLPEDEHGESRREIEHRVNVMKAKTFGFMGHANAVFGKQKDALKFIQEAESMYRSLGDSSEQANILCLMAEIINLEPGKRDKALEVAHRALELAKKAGDSKAEARAGGTIQGLMGPAIQQPVYQVASQDGGMAASAAAPAAALPKGLDPGMVQKKLMHVVEQVTGSGEEVHVDTPLMESGMDSLSAVAFRNELSRAFEGIGNLPAALMFDYPNVRAITSHLVDRSRGLA